MIAVSGGLIFIGYQLMVYGWSQVRGSNAGFFDILWPGRYKGALPDQGSGTIYTPGKGLSNIGAGGSVGLSPGQSGSQYGSQLYGVPGIITNPSGQPLGAQG